MATKSKIDTLFDKAVTKDPSDKNSRANYDEYSDIGEGGSATDGYLGNINLTSLDVQGTDSSSRPSKGVGEYDSEY